jgi:hypothetical protein
MRQLRLTVLGSIPASYTDSVESEGQQLKQFRIKYTKNFKNVWFGNLFMMTFEHTSAFYFILWIEVRDEATEQD